MTTIDQRPATATGGCAVRAQVHVPLKTPFGDWLGADVFSFTGLSDQEEHVAIGLGDHRNNPEPLVRVHSECLTGDVLGSARCDCGPQLNEALQEIEKAGGYLLYLRQEGRGIGLYNKIDTYVLQDEGLDTYEANERLDLAADSRDYQVAADMLAALGVSRVRLLTNNPEKVRQLRACGVEVTERLSTGVHLTPYNRHYLETKARVTQHAIELTRDAG
ncbi:GTP cyclohydrolase II [Streptacidiphilus jiangxiensis]|uniref:GTP cyclohydrolase-2 n=1 Tax=Streptacidiphilus jiangxiensis TaxID=235985 RepID=A0A1H7ZPS1_STRJI|nr:GTP cyclohydrolase II [Streptacidiphilus jiangxiensis]SEM59874.1 GTP cyclohydrolase II [Streptacidiphilus jiangxiensis]